MGVWLLVIPALIGRLGANPLEKLLHESGEIAIGTFGAVLALSPLRVLFPNSRILTALNRHRRAIGVTACIYGLLHFSLHVLYEGGWDGLVRSLSKPFIWFGAAGLSILVILATTSNRWSVQMLGGKNWKRLHRLAYVAAGVPLFHQPVRREKPPALPPPVLFSLIAPPPPPLSQKLFQRKHPPPSPRPPP